MIRKKRILFFGIKTFPSRGGTDRVAENLIRHLQKNFNITLFCYRETPTPTEFLSSPGLTIIRFRPFLKGSPGALLYFLRSSIRAVLMDFDLVHVHKTECAFFIPLLKLRHKVIATSHEAPYLRDKWNFLQKFYFRVAERFFIKTPNQPTCISKPLSEYYQTRYGRNVLYIPNGIQEIIVKKSFDKKLSDLMPPGADPEKPFLFFAARRLMATKGCHTFLEALHKINYTGQIFIAGENTDHSNYLQYLHKLANGLNVHFIGFVHPIEFMLKLISKSQLFVFPSETEGMSMMLLEAISSGTPVIASDIPENRILSENELLFFRSGSAGDLADKLSFALKNPDFMIVMGEKARKMVLESYSWEPIVDRYQEAYLKIIGVSQAEKITVPSARSGPSGWQWIIKQN